MLRLDARGPHFEAQFTALLHLKRESSSDVQAVALEIIAAVRARGDAALLDYTAKFDRVTLPQLAFTQAEIAAAVAQCAKKDLIALEFAAERIRSYHERQLPKDDRFTDSLGVELGYRWSAIEAVGLYVPGGTAAYPSSVLMNAIPALVAGCERRVMVVPTPEGQINPLVLAAAQLAGVTEIYRVGGAQAIAALAYGTPTIQAVDKIFGPGNAYVAAAKRLVFGQVGIDMVAGPSEVLILADETANPAFVAADMLAQAEHDVAAQSVLITDSQILAQAVEVELEKQLHTLPRAAIARLSLQNFGAIILVETLQQALPLANRLAAEHVELMCEEAEELARHIRHAGAIFIGSATPEAIGDYVGGSNHVLPTARSARFSSGLGVLDFMKRTSLLKCSPASLKILGQHAITLGEAEGLHAHARSVAARLALYNDA
jgi:histidinol dehydrogenase